MLTSYQEEFVPVESFGEFCDAAGTYCYLAFQNHDNIEIITNLLWEPVAAL